MKFCLAVLASFLTSLEVAGQDLEIIRDAVLHFEIGIPAGWKHGVPKDNAVTLIAVRQKLNDRDTVHENFNLNIFTDEVTDIDLSYKKFIASIGKAKEFRIVHEGAQVINGRRYRVLVETHLNRVNGHELEDYIWFSNDNGRVTILTMVTIRARFEAYKSLFEKVAKSLK